MEGSGVRSLQHAPKRLHPISVSLAANVLSNRVLNRFVIRQDVVGESVVGVNLGVGSVGVLHNEAAQRFALGVGDNCGLDPIGSSVLDASHGHLTHWPTARKGLAFYSAHVPALASDIGFVNLYRSSERRVAVRTGPGFADAVKHEPRRRLPYSDIPAQLHARHALEAGYFQVDSHDPLAEIDVAMGERRSGFYAEVAPAVGAPVGHRFCVGDFPGPGAPAVSAAPFPRPQCLLEPSGGRFLIGKHLEQLKDSDAFPVGFSCFFGSIFRVFHHGNSIHRSMRFVKHYG